MIRPPGCSSPMTGREMLEPATTAEDIDARFRLDAPFFACEWSTASMARHSNSPLSSSSLLQPTKDLNRLVVSVSRLVRGQLVSWDLLVHLSCVSVRSSAVFINQVARLRRQRQRRR